MQAVAKHALTHRIAHLIGEHGADPAQILAVTFTNKAAREMKDGLGSLGAASGPEPVRPSLEHPAPVEQRQLRSRIYREVTRRWIGTFHALFARMLRYDIDKFKDADLTKQFSIYDEADAQSLVKEIVTQERSWIPSGSSPKTRWAISNAKNQGWLPDQLEANAKVMGKLTADVYRRYRKALAANKQRISTICCCCRFNCSSRTSSAQLLAIFAMCWWMNIKTPTAPSDPTGLLVTDGKDPQDVEDWSPSLLSVTPTKASTASGG